MDNLFEQIENIKEKLTSQEYKDLLEKFGEIRDNDFYKITILYNRVEQLIDNGDEEDISYKIKTEIEKFVVIQNLKKSKVPKYGNYDDYDRMCWDGLRNILTEDNWSSLLTLANVEVFVGDERDDDRYNCMIDNNKSFYVKLEKL